MHSIGAYNYEPVNKCHGDTRHMGYPITWDSGRPIRHNWAVRRH